MPTLVEKRDRRLRSVEPAVAVEPAAAERPEPGPIAGDRKICFCCGVTAGRLRACLAAETRDFDRLLERTGAGAGCGSCLGDVRRIYEAFQIERSAEREGQLLLPFQPADDR